MSRPAASLALAASALAGALFLYTCSLWVYGPLFIYPVFGAPAVAGLMALRARVVRTFGGGPDPTARALEVLALGTMLAPGAGYLTAMSALHEMGGGHCGLMDTTAAATVLGRSWPVWGAGELVVLVTLGRRDGDFASLRGHEVLATSATLLAAPPLGVLACVAMGFESNHAGAAVTFLLPAATAAGAALVSWFRGRALASNAALRRLAVATSLIAAPVSLVLRSRAPLAQDCVSFATTATWGLLSEVGWAAAPFLAVMLYFARDPRSPSTGPLE